MNIIKFDNYQEEENINEGFFDFLKKLGQFATKIYKTIDKQLQNELANTTKKVESDPKNAKNIVKNHIVKQIDFFKKDVTESKNIYDIRKAFADCLFMTYVVQQDFNKSLGDKFTFDVIFKSAPDNTKKFFMGATNYDVFIKNAPNFINNIFGYFAKQSNIDIKEIAKINVKNWNEIVQDKLSADKEGQEKPVESGQKPPAEDMDQQSAGEGGGLSAESIIYKFSDKIFERYDNTFKAENLDAMKETINKWLEFSLKKPITLTIDGIKNVVEGLPDVEVQKFADSIKGSQNIESKKNLINQLTKLDASGLAVVRDAIANHLQIDKNQIGLF